MNKIKIDRSLPDFKDKNAVVKFEFNNLNYVVLMNTKKKDGSRTQFWHATMNSALMMKYLIGSGAKLHFMRDYYMSNMLRLYLCYTDRHIPAIKKKLGEAGHEIVREDEGFLVFALKEPVDVKQVKEWKKESEIVQTQVDEMYKANRNPDHLELYDLLWNLGNEIIITSRKMNSAGRDVIGVQMMKQLMLAYQEYHNFERKDVFMKNIDQISFLTDVCGVQLLIDGKRMLRMGQIFNDIREYMKKTEHAATKK